MINGDGFLFSPELTENLQALFEKQMLLSERRVCELAELASEAGAYSRELIGDGMNVYEILSLLSENAPMQKAHRSSPYQTVGRELSHSIASCVSAADRAAFAQLYTELMLFEGISIGEGDFLTARDAPQTFIYVKNLYADEAYDVFSQDFSDPRVRYALNFKEAVKAVAEGTVSYCLLPLEERGARLASIAELIYRHELKINSVIPVFGSYGDADIKYALVSRHFTLPVRRTDDDRYLEIRIAQEGPPLLSEVLSAAESYGIKLYRVNTLFFDTEDGKRGYYSVVFSGENADFTSLLVYLTLFVSDYTAVGIYKNLES